MALDVKGEDRRADHDHEIMRAKCVRKLRWRSLKEARELRMPLRETATRRKRTDPHRRSRLLRQAQHQIDSLRAIDAGADHEGRALACRECRDQRLHRVRIGAKFAANAAALYCRRLMCPV